MFIFEELNSYPYKCIDLLLIFYDFERKQRNENEYIFLTYSGTCARFTEKHNSSTIVNVEIMSLMTHCVKAKALFVLFLYCFYKKIHFFLPRFKNAKFYSNCK